MTDARRRFHPHCELRLKAGRRTAAAGQLAAAVFQQARALASARFVPQQRRLLYVAGKCRGEKGAQLVVTKIQMPLSC